MRRLFVSDIHVGKPDSQYANFAMFLHNEQFFDEIYFIGDLIDLWADNFKNIKKEYALFFSVLQALKEKNIKIFYVLGNHDLNIDVNDSFFKDLSINVTYLIEIEGKKVRLIHGHQYDFLISKYFYFTKIITCIYDLILKIFKKDLNCLKTSLSSKQNSKIYDKLVDDIEKHALADNQDCDVLLMGHTHVPKQLINGKINYFNTGDWVKHKSYVIEENGQFSLKQI